MSIYKSLMVFLASALLVPLGSRAAPRNYQQTTTTPNSQGWEFSKEATDLLKDVEMQSHRIRNAVGTLDQQSHFNEADWQTQADALDEVRDSLNTMGKDLKRLEEIRGVVQPWQQREIDRVMPLAVTLRNNTQEAIDLLNHNHSYPWATREPDDLAAIRHNAGMIARSVSRVMGIAHLNKEIEMLKQKA